MLFRSDLISGINLSGANLRNFSGDLLVTTRTDADLTAAANVGSGGAIAGANANAFSALSSDNTITVSDAELLGTDVKLRAGQDASRVTNLLMNTARADMKLVALYGLRMAPLLDLSGGRRVAGSHLVIDESTAMGIAHEEGGHGALGFFATDRKSTRLNSSHT